MRRLPNPTQRGSNPPSSRQLKSYIWGRPSQLEMASVLKTDEC
ncbi:hypothetical protein [Yersinia phage vB_YenM_P778]